MTTEEIKEGIKLLCETSKTIQNCYDNKEFLAEEINKAKRSDIEKCWQYYQHRSGVIVDVRKELIQHIIDDEYITVDLLEQLVKKHREGKENQFKTYKNFYTIFYGRELFIRKDNQ